MKFKESVYLVASGKMGFDWTHPSDCNVYLLESRGELALIDSGTGDSVDAICAEIESLGFSLSQVKQIFLTHIHADHAGGAALLKERTGAKVAVAEKAYGILKAGDEEAIDLALAKKNGFYPEDYQFTPCEADLLLKEGDQFSIGELKLKVLETPGHSRFDLSFAVTAEKGEALLFSGDTIFYDGKISMLLTKDFNIQELARSMVKLNRIKADVLLPGHYHPALNHAASHIAKAHQTFEKMGIPKNIVE
ncbi:MBL fold metallo-hydrolase [Planococcus sp. N028]|uniref:MBL fold metallo-hydrolase n=1 Tax=Planococcus shixiaomingii TaxID=3058393 RepID=A0ABT8N4T2_9BACL|nr:MBL fold metallo-hydrolase [Planococcus sp. N028]MDN7242883.1 MBL fold metallo-hydrolase [Planococcus sp. N028]